MFVRLAISTKYAILLYDEMTAVAFGSASQNHVSVIGFSANGSFSPPVEVRSSVGAVVVAAGAVVCDATVVAFVVIAGVVVVQEERVKMTNIASSKMESRFFISTPH